MIALVDASVKVAFVLLLALFVSVFLRRQSAGMRHWVLSTALLSALALPMLGALLPDTNVRVPVPAMISGTVAATDVPPHQIAAGLPFEPAAGSSPASASFENVMAATVAVWAGGAALLLLVLGVGVVRLHWLALRARPLTSGAWCSAAADLAGALGVRRPVRLLLTHHPTLLVTWGWRRPSILLPSDVHAWPIARIRVVLAHELAHIRRNDWSFQIVAELLRCAYWFNPLAWIAARRLRQESEYACDDAVLGLGIAPSEYATELVSVARQFTRSRNRWSPALAVAGQSGLEGRVRAMLNHERNRRPLTPVLRIAAALGFAAVTLPIAALQTVAAQTFNTLSGFVFDSSDAVLPNTTMTLVNTETQAKYEVKSDRSGRFEFVGLPQGDYSLQATLPGFSILRGALTIAGQDAQRDLKLKVGSLEETVTVVGGPGAPRDTAPAPPAPELKGRGIPPCGAGPTTSGGIPIGGNIRPPRKLKHVSPVYPPQLMDAGVTGLVILDTLIGADGRITQARAVNDPHPELAAAAIEAIRQWEFDETLLNCVPIEVVMKVTVNFALKQYEPTVAGQTNQTLDSLEEARARLVEHEKRLEEYRRQYADQLRSQNASQLP